MEHGDRGAAAAGPGAALPRCGAWPVSSSKQVHVPVAAASRVRILVPLAAGQTCLPVPASTADLGEHASEHHATTSQCHRPLPRAHEDAQREIRRIKSCAECSSGRRTLDTGG